MPRIISFSARTSINVGFRRCSAALLLVTAFFGSAVIWAEAAVNQDVEARVASLLKTMTLEQKVGQMVQGEIKTVAPADLTKYHLGSILNGGGSFPNESKKFNDERLVRPV